MDVLPEDMMLKLGVTPRFIRGLIDKLLHSAIVGGHLSAKDIANREEALASLREIVSGNQVEFVIDHRDRLLMLAVDNQKANREELSVLFFALYFEHTINHILGMALAKKHFSAEVSKGFLRACSINDKFTWALELLELPPFYAAHRKTIFKIAEERNAYAHYKWSPKDFSKKLDALLDAGRKAATYLKKYEAKLAYQGAKGRVKIALKKVTRTHS